MQLNSKIMTIKISSENEIDRAAAEFLKALGNEKHIAFHAPMGAGKTTFISALCRALGVSDDVSSPTFSIINEYRTSEGKPIYHFDFYRIEDRREAMDLGLDDYFDSGALCLMEWPENVADFLPDDTVNVEIRVNDKGERELITV